MCTDGPGYFLFLEAKPLFNIFRVSTLVSSRYVPDQVDLVKDIVLWNRPLKSRNL